MLDKKAIVLAAGKGVRMNSELPKVLIPVCGKPMIEYVLQALVDAGVTQITVVVGYRGEEVRSAVADWFDQLEDCDDDCMVFFVEQVQQQGTGHAVMAAREVLEGDSGPVMILTGDSPMTRRDSLVAMFEEYEKNCETSEASPIGCFIGTCYKDDPFGMGRIIRDSQGEFERIVEEKDATDEQRAIHEVNMSYYLFDIPSLLESLGRLHTKNAQNEYYITDVPAIMKAQGKKVLARPLLLPCEALGVNTPEDLAAVEKAMQGGN